MTTLTVLVRVITTGNTCNIHMTTLTVFVKVITGDTVLVRVITAGNTCMQTYDNTYSIS